MAAPEMAAKDGIGEPVNDATRRDFPKLTDLYDL
jgi:hypothetical protein